MGRADACRAIQILFFGVLVALALLAHNFKKEKQQKQPQTPKPAMYHLDQGQEILQAQDLKLELAQDLEILQAQDLIQTQRKQTVQKVCAEQKKTGVSVKSDRWRTHSIYLYAEKLFYCQMPKTGSTTWMHWFENIYHLDETHKKKWDSLLHGWLFKLLSFKVKGITNHDIFLLTQNAWKVTHVRHPFVRLVSAYQDKVIDTDQIHWRTRLLQYKSTTPLSNGLPTFSQLVEYVLETNGMGNEHFLPMWHACNFCFINYDLIVKQEFADVENEYVFNKTGLGLLIGNHQQKLHVSSVGRTEQLALTYFATVTPWKRKLLYKVFELDFKLFEYDPEPYLSLPFKTEV